MNSTRYIFANLASSFGLHLKNKRLSEAADEAHLLRQAEEILGEYIWEKVENIDAVNVEYWNLRKHQIAMEKLEGEIQGANEILEASHEKRNIVLNDTSDDSASLEETKDDLLAKSAKMAADRDAILAKAKQIKRNLEASATKVTVLKSQEEKGLGVDNQELIQQENDRRAAYKRDFVDLKKERERLRIEMESMNCRISDIDAELNASRKRLRDKAVSAYHNIGEATRNQSKLRAEVGMNEQEMSLYFAEIGQYVSSNIDKDPACAEVCGDHATLVTQIQMLRSSIELNHKLAAKAGS